MNVHITDFARWQLRLTLQDLRRKRDPEAARLMQRVRELLTSPTLLHDALSPVADMPELPHAQVSLGSYTLYFRHSSEKLWLVGLWPPMYPE